MKIKDLPNTANLGNLKFKVPAGHPEIPFTEAYWVSQWGYSDGGAGIWCKKDLNETRIYPLFLDSLKEALEFEVVEN